LGGTRSRAEFRQSSFAVWAGDGRTDGWVNGWMGGWMFARSADWIEAERFRQWKECEDIKEEKGDPVQ
jgi:hypothetical protein